MGDSRESLQGFPEDVRAVFGRALFKAQLDKRHQIAGQMRGALRGVTELAQSHSGDAYRLYYTMKCAGFVYVLHCHKKKSKRGIQLPRYERDLIVRRLGFAMGDCRETQGGPS